MNEQILQKIRHAYDSSSLGEWKLNKMPDGQLMIALGKRTVAVVGTLEDAIFIENAHRYLPAILSCIRNVPQPAQVPAAPAVPVASVAPAQPAAEVKKAGRPPKQKVDEAVKQVVPAAPVTKPVALIVAPVTAPVPPVKKPVVITPKVVVAGAAIPTVVLPAEGNLVELT